MPRVVSFVAPHEVVVEEVPPAPLDPGSVRVTTWYSGISAGTELTAYRGSNPYLTGTWDAGARLFRPGEPTFAYPVRGWGHSEVGQVTEVGDGVADLEVGQVVHGIWGHRSDAVGVPTDSCWTEGVARATSRCRGRGSSTASPGRWAS